MILRKNLRPLIVLKNTKINLSKKMRNSKIIWKIYEKPVLLTHFWMAQKMKAIFTTRVSYHQKNILMND